MASHAGRFLAARLLLASALAVAGEARGLDPARALTQFPLQVWTNEDGLPQSSVQAIVQSRDGYLWLGTQEGLVRFDGVRFTVYDRANTRELKSNVIWALCEDREGAIWAGTDRGVIRLKDGTFTSLGVKEGLSGELVRSIVEDREGALWIGTDGGGLARLENGTIRTLTKKEGMPGDNIRPLLVDSRGTLWAGAMGGGLAQIKGKKPVELPPWAKIPSDRVAALLEGRDGSIWVGTIGQGVTRLKDGRLETYTTRDGLANDFVWSLHEDSDGGLWIGTEGGLSRLAFGRLTSLTEKQGLPSDRVWSIREDREKNLWIGTDGGLVRLKEGKFLSYTAREGLVTDVAMCVMEGQDGSIWTGTAGGLSRLKARTFTSWTLKDGLPNERVWALAEDAAGTLWIGTDGGVARLDDGKITTVEEIPKERVRALLPDPSGVLWVGTLGGGLKRYQDGKVTTYKVEDGLASNRVRFLHLDRQKTLWAGSTGGLTRIRDGAPTMAGALTAYRSRDGLPNDLLVCIHEDEDGTFWIGTFGGGLLRYRGGKWRQVTTMEGLLEDVVFRILPDGRDGFWMSSSKGISRVARSELEDLLAGRRSRVSPVSFTKDDGMPNTECNGGSQPAGWKAKDGLLWFPTIKGIVGIHPERIPRNPIPPAVSIEGLWADGALVPAGSPLSVAPGRRRFEIQYAGLSLVAPRKVRFRYRLEGLDDVWVEAEGRRAAYYTNLPPGAYRFEVLACNNDGVWSEKPAVLEFELRPFFRQTAAFRLILAGAVALAVFGLHRLRTYRLKERGAELERVVAERTRSLEEAQKKIAKLAESASEGLRDIPTWSRAMAEDLARTVGAREIGVFLVDRNSVASLTQTAVTAPTVEELQAASRRPDILHREDQVLVPVTGLSGQLYGGLVVDGKDCMSSEAARRLIASFAHQLGSALEVQKMRRELSAVEAHRSATVKEMLDRGIDLVQECPECGRCFDQKVKRCTADGGPLSGPRPLAYRILGRYRLVRLLGQGGMGTVYEARDERLDRDVALKIIRSDQIQDSEVRLRIEREARAIARIDHQGVVAIYDSGELEDRSAFLVMELLHGIDLGALMKAQGKGSPRQVARLLRQGAAALAAAHRAGVIHRDIKPGNVFIEEGPGGDFDVKILDFGLAKNLRMEATLTQAGVVLGTPAYMSPEQMLGRELTPESDVYSFATVVFEALTGVRLVSSDEFAELASEVLYGKPPAVSSFCRYIPREVNEAFFQALAKNAKDRPSDVEKWAESLASLLETVPFDGAGWPDELRTIARRPAVPLSEATERIAKPA